MRYGIIMNESDRLLQLLTVCAIDSVRHRIWHAISAGRPHWAVLRCSKPNAPGSCASHRRSQLGGLSRRVLAWHLLRAFWLFLFTSWHMLPRRSPLLLSGHGANVPRANRDVETNETRRTPRCSLLEEHTGRVDNTRTSDASSGLIGQGTFP